MTPGTIPREQAKGGLQDDVGGVVDAQVEVRVVVVRQRAHHDVDEDGHRRGARVPQPHGRPGQRHQRHPHLCRAPGRIVVGGGSVGECKATSRLEGDLIIVH